MKTALIPYLHFDGTAAQALRFYQSFLGGDLTLQTYGEAFPETPEDLKERTMHGMLTTPEFSIMAGDAHPEMSKPLSVGNNVALSFVGGDEKKLREIWEQLTKKGTVEMSLEKQFWGDLFGACVDEFGVHWMVNITMDAQ